MRHVESYLFLFWQNETKMRNSLSWAKGPTEKSLDQTAQEIYLFCKYSECKSCQVVSALLEVFFLECNKSNESVSREIISVQIVAFQVSKLLNNNSK